MPKTKRITLKAAQEMTTKWFQLEWGCSFQGYQGIEPDPLRLEDLLSATHLVWKGYPLNGARVVFPSGNSGTPAQVFGCYKHGDDFLEELLVAVGRSDELSYA